MLLLDSMDCSNLGEIKGKFACLLLEVQSALKANHVEIDEVRNFLIGMFRCDDECIPNTNMSDIFNAVTRNNFWDHENHSPVETLLRNLIPDHRSMMVPYKDKLAGYYATTTLIDYIQNRNLQDDSDTEIDAKRYSTQQYRRLRVKLKVPKGKMSQISMLYVRDLWISFAEEFDIPPLTAVIDDILEGSLEIVWLILPHFAELISKSAGRSVGFFHQHDIIYVTIDNEVLYDAQLTVSCLVHSTWHLRAGNLRLGKFLFL